MTTDRTITDLPADRRPHGWPWEVTTAAQSDRIPPEVFVVLHSQHADHSTHGRDPVGYLRPSVCPTCATAVRLIEGTDPMPDRPAPEPTPVQLSAALLRARVERADALGLQSVGVPVDHLRAVLDAWADTL